MKIVICEGPDDESVIKGLIRHEKLANIQVESYKGIGELARVARGFRQRPEFTQGLIESFAITVDADQNRASRWQKVSDLVRNVFDVQLLEEGIPAGTRPKITGLVVGVGSAGNLEDVCLKACEGSRGFSCHAAYFQCLEKAASDSKYSSKAKFRAWMATQDDFEFGVGKAADKDYFPWGHTAFDPLRNLLKNL